jgi:hypothetical protein
VAVPEADIRETVAEVLSRRAYEDVDPSVVARVLTAVRDAVARLLTDAFGSSVGAMVGYGLLVLAAVVAVVVAARLVRRTQRDAGIRQQHVAARQRSVDEWLEDAARFAADDDHASAVRAAFRALLASLDERGVFDDRPATSVGEAIAAVHATVPDLAPAVADAGACFERVHYGHRPATPTDTATVLAAVESTRRAQVHA